MFCGLSRSYVPESTVEAVCCGHTLRNHLSCLMLAANCMLKLLLKVRQLFFDGAQVIILPGELLLELC